MPKSGALLSYCWNLFILKVITKKEKKENENKNFLHLGIEPTPVPAVGSL